MISSLPQPHGHRAGLGLAVTDHEHERRLVQLRLSDLGPDFLVPHIDGGSQSAAFQLLAHLLGVLGRALGDREHSNLLGREPKGERPRTVFDEDPDEPLQRSEHRPVDQHRSLLSILGVNVSQIEAFR